MRSEVTKWALLTSGCLLGGLITLIGVLAILGYALSQYMANRPEPPDSRNYEFYYSQTSFTRSAASAKFTEAEFVSTEEGPWLWTSETEGFKVDRANALETGRQIAQQLGLKEPHQYNDLVRVGEQSWSVWLTTVDSHDRRNDGRINAEYADVPIAISLTKDGPRISLQCTEEELRRAFGKPTKIIRTSTVGAPGV